MQGTNEKGDKAATTAEGAACRLDVEVLEASPERLTLRYSFLNASDRSAYLFNRLYDKLRTEPDGKVVFQTDPNRLYVELDHGQAILSKKIFPVPPDLDVEQPNVPCATRVKPGETVSETVSVTLPLARYNPYLRGAATGEEARATKVWFELGFFLVPPEGERLARSVDTTGGAAYHFSSAQPGRQTLLRVGPLPVTAPVRRPE